MPRKTAGAPAPPIASVWSLDRNWDALRERTGKEIERAVREVPDAAVLDENIIEHVKQGGAGDQSRINDVPRAYVTSKRLDGESREGGDSE